MCKQKPITPYQRLLADAQKFALAVNIRTRKLMWFYPKEKLGASWSLKNLAERTAAAEQLGYDVQLVNKDDGLHVYYVKKLPDRPWSFK